MSQVAPAIYGTTQEQLIEQVTALGKLTGRAAQDLLSCNMGELQQLAISYADAAQGAAPTWFDTFLKVLGYVVQVVGVLVPVASAFTTVFGMVSAGKTAAS